MPLYIILFIVGAVIIIKSGDVFVDSARYISTATGIPRVVIGATIVSLATTTPEIFVSLMATSNGSYDLAVGNCIGSLICNISLILATTMIISPPKINDKSFKIKILILLSVTVLLFIVIYDSKVSVFEAAILFAFFLLFTIISIISGKEEMEEFSQNNKKVNKALSKNIILFIIGAAGVVIGSRLLVDNATQIARSLNISEAFIGLTIVALGTSLPEYITTITSLIKKESSLGVGNIIGANLLNSTLILPLSSFISNGGLTVSERTFSYDLPITLIITAIAFVPPLIKGRFNKIGGIVLLLIYGYYIFSLTAI